MSQMIATSLVGLSLIKLSRGAGPFPGIVLFWQNGQTLTLQIGSSWEAANIGMGAHLHETGHLFGCPHQESGVMLRDYVTLNRSFLTRESFSTRTKSKGGLVLEKDECRLKFSSEKSQDQLPRTGFRGLVHEIFCSVFDLI